MRLRRLRVEYRVLCALGPLGAVGLLIVARAVMPFVWAHPRLAALVARPCLLRSTTGIPCPFCGSTRAVVLAAQGQWLGSVLMNPLGGLLVLGGPLLALWLGACAVSGRDLGLTAVGWFVSRHATFPRLLALVGLLWAWKLLLALTLGL